MRSTNPTLANPGKQKGLSLIELMVAVTIGLILLAGVIQIFTSNKQTYRVQAAMARVQENGRLAMQLLSQDIRMADFWGCNSTASKVSSHLNLAADEPYKVFATYHHAKPTDGGIYGTDDTEGAPSATNRADTIVVQGAFGPGVPLTSHVGEQFILPATTGITLNEPIVVSNCLKTDLAQVTSVNTATGEVLAQTGVGTPGNNPAITFPAYGTDAQVYVPRRIEYSIQDDGTTGERGLYMKIDGSPQMMLVLGVEDMQILYGVDTSADLVPDQYVSAATLNTGTADQKFAKWANVITVRVELTVRSDDNIATQTTDAGDRRLRRTFASTIAVRNRVIDKS
ncbi:MAG: PilW family protein [Pseudomonadota bacterium]